LKIWARKFGLVPLFHVDDLQPARCRHCWAAHALCADNPVHLEFVAVLAAVGCSVNKLLKQKLINNASYC